MRVKTFVPNKVMMGMVFQFQCRMFQVVNFDHNSQKWICRPMDNYTCYRYFTEKQIRETLKIPLDK